MPEVFMPRLSDTMTEGVITQWVKHEGDPVRRGDVLAEIETDKAVMELEAYEEGVLRQILVPAGATVPIGDPIARIGDATGAGPLSAATPAAASAGGGGHDAEAPAPDTAHVANEERAESRPPAVQARSADGGGPGIATSPLARAVARQHGIDLAGVRGSGPGGRIVRADVEAAVAAQEVPPPATTPSQVPASSPVPQAPAASPVPQAPADVEEIPLTAIRRVTARRLAESAVVPHFDLTAVVDVEPLLALRAEVNEQLGGAVKISVTDLLVRASALALRAHPGLNASWGGDKLLRHNRVHIGIAVALDDGLIVPVVRDADRKSVRTVAVEARELAQRARSGRLTPEEFTGGTFTLSNLGMYAVDRFTAVLNPPEAAILAVGAATAQPVVRDGQLAAGTTLALTLSVDHRVSDGATGAAFLAELRGLVEHPLRIVA